LRILLDRASSQIQKPKRHGDKTCTCHHKKYFKENETENAKRKEQKKIRQNRHPPEQQVKDRARTFSSIRIKSIYGRFIDAS
jgi:hypothetical protein